MSYGQDTHHKDGHSWLYIDEYGALDISPNLSRSSVPNPNWVEVPFEGIFGSTWMPTRDGEYIECCTADEYAQKISACSFMKNKVHAVYWQQRKEKLPPEILLAPFDLIKSPLSDKLYEDFGTDIYAKAVLHLLKRASGRARSLATVSRQKAWKIISEQTGNAFDEVMNYRSSNDTGLAYNP